MLGYVTVIHSYMEIVTSSHRSAVLAAAGFSFFVVLVFVAAVIVVPILRMNSVTPALVSRSLANRRNGSSCKEK